MAGDYHYILYIYRDILFLPFIQDGIVNFLFMTSAREYSCGRFHWPSYYDFPYLTGQGPNKQTSVLGQKFQVGSRCYRKLGKKSWLCFDNFIQLPENLHFLISFVQNKCFVVLYLLLYPNVIMCMYLLADQVCPDSLSDLTIHCNIYNISFQTIYFINFYYHGYCQ